MPKSPVPPAERAAAPPELDRPRVDVAGDRFARLADDFAGLLDRFTVVVFLPREEADDLPVPRRPLEPAERLAPDLAPPRPVFLPAAEEDFFAAFFVAFFVDFFPLSLPVDFLPVDFFFVDFFWAMERLLV
jgi:hypothetical protein